MDILANLPIILIVFAIGSSFGSFINVVAYRIPAGLSVLHPPSRCPRCLHRLGIQENVPVLGWMWLRGRCRHCHSPISSRYPLVEGMTGLLFLLVFWRFGVTLQTLGFWTFLGWLLTLSLIDWDTMTLPNVLTRSGLILGLVYQVIQGWILNGTAGSIGGFVLEGMVGAVVGLWLFDTIAFVGSLAFGQTAMGGGDTKLAAMMGAWLGWKYLLLAGFLACAVGAFAGGGAIALGWLDRRQPMPFGPFLALGAALAALCGDWILSTYWHLFFPSLAIS